MFVFSFDYYGKKRNNGGDNKLSAVFFMAKALE